MLYLRDGLDIMGRAVLRGVCAILVRVHALRSSRTNEWTTVCVGNVLRNMFGLCGDGSQICCVYTAYW